MRTSPRSAGFTLVELMITIAILAIVSAIAVPSFNTMIQNNRLTAATNDLAGALHYARAEAVRRGRPVQVDALDDDIANGVRVWFDADDDDSFDDDDTEELRLVRLSSVAGLAVGGDIDGTSTAKVSMTYGPRGSVSGMGNQLTLTFCDDRVGDHGRALNLLSSGVLRLTTSVSCS